MIFDIWGTERRRGLTAGDKHYLFITVAKGKCEYCKKNLVTKGIKPNIHHIVEWASRGSDSYHNLIVLCPDCHSRAHNDQISKEELRAKIAYRLPKKAAAEDSTKRKIVTKKTTPKKTATKKSTVRKTAPKQSPTKKSAASKTAPKKATAKKPSARKTTTKKISTKKTTVRKTAPKQTSAKRVL